MSLFNYFYNLEIPYKIDIALNQIKLNLIINLMNS